MGSEKHDPSAADPAQTRDTWVANAGRALGRIARQAVVEFDEIAKHAKKALSSIQADPQPARRRIRRLVPAEMLIEKLAVMFRECDQERLQSLLRSDAFWSLIKQLNQARLQAHHSLRPPPSEARKPSSPCEPNGDGSPSDEIAPPPRQDRSSDEIGDADLLSDLGLPRPAGPQGVHESDRAEALDVRLAPERSPLDAPTTDELDSSSPAEPGTNAPVDDVPLGPSGGPTASEPAEGLTLEPSKEPAAAGVAEDSVQGTSPTSNEVIARGLTQRLAEPDAGLRSTSNEAERLTRT